MMWVTFSTDVEAFYITVSDEPVAHTVEIGDLTMVDVDSHGQPVGVEFAMRADALQEPMYQAVVDRFPSLGRGHERAHVVERIVAAMRSAYGRESVGGPKGSELHVIAGLSFDTVADAAEWVTRLGGRATVVVPTSGMLMPLDWVMTDPSEALAIAADSRVHPGSTLGILAEYLLSREDPSTEFSFRIAVDESREAAITEKGPLRQLA